MSLVNPVSYVVIQGWMISELKLKGNELLVYAIIFGFSQAEGQKYTGGLRYLIDWTNSSKQGVIKVLKSLVAKGLIRKEIRSIKGVNFVDYHATSFNGVVNFVDLGGKQSCMTPGQLCLPNNLSINNLPDNLRNTIERCARTREVQPYGKFRHVLLTTSEYEQLQDKYGAIMAKAAVDFLDRYKERKRDYQSDNDFVTIECWVIEAVRERGISENQSFDVNEFFELALKRGDSLAMTEGST